MKRRLEITVTTATIPLSSASTQVLAQADTYDWILFTSKHAVDYFVHALKRQKIRLPKTPRIGVVGPSTATAARKAGLKVSVVSKRHTANDLARSLSAIHKKRILFPRSAIAAQEPVTYLRKNGARVVTIPLYTSHYQPITAKDRQHLLAGTYDELRFSSPSGIQGFMRSLTGTERKVARCLKAICIGPTTAEAARAAGFKKVVKERIL